jgi:hypothetical protein
METFISSILEDGLVKIELTVRPETAQHLYTMYLKGELSSAVMPQSPSEAFAEKAAEKTPSDEELTPIQSFNELDGNEIALLAALAGHPPLKPIPTSRALVAIVDWQHYSKSGSDDETSRASALRVTMQKLDKKGLFARRGLKGNTERLLTEQGLQFAKEAQEYLERLENFEEPQREPQEVMRINPLTFG